MDSNRLGISGITTNKWSLREDLNALERHGIRNLGLWLYKCENLTNQEVNHMIKSKDISISNVCFSGMFTGATEDSRNQAIQQSKKAVDFTKEVDAGCLLIVSGPIGNHTYQQALDHVRNGLYELCEYAEKKKVHLGLEALHPMALTDHSVVNKLETACAIISELQSDYLGVFLDTFNIGWDPSYANWIPKCAGKIKGVHLADWRNPTQSFNDRALPGQGVFDIIDMIQLIEQTGYTGPYDVEIFSDELWNADYDSILFQVKEWFSSIRVEGFYV